MQGYWDDVEKTQEAIDSHGWFHSGYDTAVDVICKLDGCDMPYFMLVLELIRRLSLLVYLVDVSFILLLLYISVTMSSNMEFLFSFSTMLYLRISSNVKLYVNVSSILLASLLVFAICSALATCVCIRKHAKIHKRNIHHSLLPCSMCK